MKFRVTALFVELHSGVLTLTKEQARDRLHNLRKVKNGYEIVKPVQFKQGEEIGYDGEITHQLAEAFGVKPAGKNSKSAAGDGKVQTPPQDNLGDAGKVQTPAQDNLGDAGKVQTSAQDNQNGDGKTAE